MVISIAIELSDNAVEFFDGGLKVILVLLDVHLHLHLVEQLLGKGSPVVVESFVEDFIEDVSQHISIMPVPKTNKMIRTFNIVILIEFTKLLYTSVQLLENYLLFDQLGKSSLSVDDTSLQRLLEHEIMDTVEEGHGRTQLDISAQSSLFIDADTEDRVFKLVLKLGVRVNAERQ